MCWPWTSPTLVKALLRTSLRLCLECRALREVIHLHWFCDKRFPLKLAPHVLFKAVSAYELKVPCHLDNEKSKSQHFGLV